MALNKTAVMLQLDQYVLSPKSCSNSTASVKSKKDSSFSMSKKTKMNNPSKLEIMEKIESNDFKGLNEDRLNDCWQEMARQIKSYKRKLRKVTEWCEAEENKFMDTKSSFELAHRVINQKAKDSPKDHQDLLPNLIQALNQDKLKPGSLAFDRICSLVRCQFSQQNLMSIKSNGDFAISLKVGEQKVPITTQEYDLMKDFRKETSKVQLLCGSYPKDGTISPTNVQKIPSGLESSTIAADTLSTVKNFVTLPMPDFTKKAPNSCEDHSGMLLPSINSLCMAIRTQSNI